MRPTVCTATALLNLTFFMSTYAQTVTLYDLSESPLPSQTVVYDASFSISAGGTNSNGGTTYVEIIGISSFVEEEPSTTFTVFSAPTTITGSEDTSKSETGAVSGGVRFGGWAVLGEVECDDVTFGTALYQPLRRDSVTPPLFLPSHHHPPSSLHHAQLNTTVLRVNPIRGCRVISRQHFDSARWFITCLFLFYTLPLLPRASYLCPCSTKYANTIFFFPFLCRDLSAWDSGAAARCPVI
ncbi:hypothetical protein B0H19DRAFT_1385198 [Mycena capillaripes]|nr:hypothetical protein B0H19DRAFT_1385198 [Mycena capillaripes]